MLRLEAGVIGRCDKAGTLLGDVREFAVADDAGVGVFDPQIFQQLEHGSFLGLGPGVIGMAFRVEAAFIADADGAAVVVAGMGTTDILRENRHHLTIHSDVVVIGGLAEATHTGRNQGFDTERPCHKGC